MPLYQIKLLDKKEVAFKTIEFTFEKPNPFTFVPGQYGGFTLINPSKTDAKGATRRFSILSTPNDDVISIVTRLQGSAFKEVLLELPIGSTIKMAGPTGTFVLSDDLSIPSVLIAGGIGVAPFYSMIKQAAIQKSPRKIYLFYGNPSLKDAAFLNELRDIENQYPHFSLIATIDQPDEDWSDEIGLINSDMICKYVKELDQVIYYVCGSPSMVKALHQTLLELNINEDRIRVEDFPGY
jgi:ferredoxin-NADP reductase